MGTAFQSAVDRWEDIIVNTHKTIDLPAGTTDASSISSCGSGSVFPAGTTQITGLTIFATVGYIDGEGNTLGYAGPCGFSYADGTTTTFGFTTPRLGQMTFDEDDLSVMLADGTFEGVIMHEIGHILGLGTLWTFLREGSAGVGDNDPRYTGVHGMEGYQDLGGLRANVPVANTGGSGTANSHWRESVFGDELMTGYADGAMAASIMTVKALKDLGYTVDESKAEAFALDVSLRNLATSSGTHRMMGDDVIDFLEPMEFNPNDVKP
jgi:hypothetical protein